MVDVYVETHQTVEIKMSGKEASWLRGYLQNTLTTEETPEDVRNRKEIFTALNNAGIK